MSAGKRLADGLNDDVMMIKILLMDLFKAFLVNDLVNTFQRATMEAVSQWTNVIAHW
jgi:hypothetical protein